MRETTQQDQICEDREERDIEGMETVKMLTS
jgi:hypothetical protein